MKHAATLLFPLLVCFLLCWIFPWEFLTWRHVYLIGWGSLVVLPGTWTRLASLHFFFFRSQGPRLHRNPLLSHWTLQQKCLSLQQCTSRKRHSLHWSLVKIIASVTNVRRCKRWIRHRESFVMTLEWIFLRHRNHVTVDLRKHFSFCDASQKRKTYKIHVSWSTLAAYMVPSTLGSDMVRTRWHGTRLCTCWQVMYGAAHLVNWMDIWPASIRARGALAWLQPEVTRH